MSSCTVEEVASSCDAIRFFQLYVIFHFFVSFQFAGSSIFSCNIFIIVSFFPHMLANLLHRCTRDEIYQHSWCRELKEMDTRQLSSPLMLQDLAEGRQTLRTSENTILFIMFLHSICSFFGHSLI